MEFVIFLSLFVGLLQGLNKIIATREGKLQPAQEYPNILAYLLRE